MKPNTFRTVMILLAVVAVLIMLAIAIYIFMQPKKCPTVSCPMSTPVPAPRTYAVEDRDRKVISDQLYPPLNRTDEKNHVAIVREVQTGQLYQNSTDRMDSFRLVGYLTNSEPIRDAGGNNWKLFARMKDRNQGEFYIVPSNNNIDLKIPLTSDIVVGERLRDLYSLPKEMRFNSPMLNKGPYQFTEMPKADFGSSRYV
jgi:hypothetical protein